MKLRYIATTLVSAYLISITVGAAEIYNKDGNELVLFARLTGRYYLSENQENNGDRSYLRYGFRGHSCINNNIIAFGEWNNINNVNNYDLRGKGGNSIGFAGLNFGDYGSFNYGSNYGVLYDIAAWTNTMLEFSGSNSYNSLSGQATSLATYRNKNLFGIVDGLAIALQYQAQETKNADQKINKIKSINGDGYGLSVQYDLGNGITIGSAYANSKRATVENILDSNPSNLAETYSLGMKYDANNIYFAAIYSQTYHMPTFSLFRQDKMKNISYIFTNQVYNIELVAHYTFDFNLTPSIGYVQSKGYGLNIYHNHDIKKYILIGASYIFNDNMSTFIDYRINLMKEDIFTKEANIRTDNIIAAGITYLF